VKFIRLEFDDDVAVVSLSNPEGNRINFQMREEIYLVLERIGASDVRVLLIRGEGKDFCLGGDIREWVGVPSDRLRPRVEVFAKALDLLAALRIPTLAAVQGGCMGGGFELALACDMIIAASSAKFMFPEALIGLMTLQGGVYSLAERIGPNKAMELILLPEPVPAERMAEWNVVNRVVGEDALASEAAAIARQLALGSPDAYARTKALMNVWRRGGPVEARASLYDITMPLFDTQDVQTALRDAVTAVAAGQPFPKATFERSSRPVET